MTTSGRPNPTTTTLGNWIERAACAGMPTNLFFDVTGPRRVAALTICRHCPVKTACLTAAQALPARMRYVGMIMGGRYWSSYDYGHRLDDDPVHSRAATLDHHPASTSGHPPCHEGS